MSKERKITITARLARLSTQAVKENLCRCIELLYQRGEFSGELRIKRENGELKIAQYL